MSRASATLTLLALPLALAAPLLAQPMPVPGRADPSLATPGQYRVDPAHTQVLWRVNHMGFSEFDGAFAEPTGALVIGATPAATRLTIDIPIARVTTTSAGLNKHLMSADFFDAARFPTARFEATGVSADPRSGAVTIPGRLTLRGVTRPVTLTGRFVGAGANPMSKATTIGFRATGAIMRSEFGMGAYVPAVSDRVELTINAAFERR